MMTVLALTLCFIYIFMFVTLMDIMATKIGNYLLNFGKNVLEEDF
jgi:hypothetical protein